MENKKITYKNLLKEEEYFLKKFGEKVRFYRLTKKKYSQLDLSLESGLDKNYIGGVERGERNITILKAKQLADSLEVDIKDLFEKGEQTNV
ncbi:helix-turn-helix domain-containing protein [Listeria seeligeri]|uniref:helix-turn-helix domain-containing protein n=1 Tax=Listeria seeligeri TaxID=1640 RepID=UPI0018887F42|nr:helix-turn-helix transcriptional regulator [Listeria seeligeri]MBF2641054.1 helix-turn-helix transcriptional regulator [Listeria seeligeri]